MDVELREGVAPPLRPQADSNPLTQLLKLAIIFALAGLATYLVLTAPTHWARLTYWWAHRGEGNSAQLYVDINAPADSFAGAVGAALRQPTFAKPAAGRQTESAAPSVDLGLEPNHLVIPKINVKTPIVWNGSSDEKIMLANLQSGVAHYGFTSLPNRDTGNVFITGHSSYYWWDKGRYKTVFALLDRLTPGDQAFIQYEGTIYVYQLRDERVVNPENVEVTDPTEEPILTLMTCTPVGTSLRRLISRFDLVKTYSADGSSASTQIETAPPTQSTPSSTPADTVPTDRDRIQLLPGLR